jgi:uncharacterized Zn finger protein (UPF0148 family)
MERIQPCMPPEEPEEDWMRELHELGASLDGDLPPCPVCGEPARAGDARCRLCGRSLVESIEPDSGEDDAFRSTLRSTLRTVAGDPAEEAPEEEMWEALDSLAEIPAREAEAARSPSTTYPRWLGSVGMIIVGALVYALLLSAGIATLVGVAAMALGAVLIVIGLNGLVRHARLRIPRGASRAQTVFPFILLGIGVVGYLLPLALGGDPIFAVSTMAVGALLLVMGVNAFADLFAVRGSEA